MENSRSKQTFFTLALLLLLGISMLLCAVLELGGYEKLNLLAETSSKEHLPYAYLMQKMRNAHDIEVENSVLKIRNGESLTFIYCHKNHLYELTTLYGYDFNPDYGESLFDMDDMEVKKENNRVIVTYSVNNTEKEVIYALRGMKDE